MCIISRLMTESIRPERLKLRKYRYARVYDLEDEMFKLWVSLRCAGVTLFRS